MSNVICEEAGTTVEPPVCPGCGGVGWNSNAAGGMVTCGRCGGCGEDLLAVASCPDTDEEVEPSQEILLALLREEMMSYRRQAQMASRWERIG